MKKVISVAVLICVIALSLSACFAESDKFIGEWECEKGISIIKVTNKLTFNDDFTGSFTIEGLGTDADMTWSVDEEAQTLTIDPAGDAIPTFTVDYEFDEETDNLILTGILGLTLEFYPAED